MTKRIALSVLLFASMFALPAMAGGDVSCKMTFKLAGWSAFYKTSAGTGTIKCSNGQSARVKLDAKGGGPSIGKSQVDHGKGQFSGVDSIEELFGSYISTEANAGAVKSANANVMTKGAVSLALRGTGRGWELGVAFGRLSIERQ